MNQAKLGFHLPKGRKRVIQHQYVNMDLTNKERDLDNTTYIQFNLKRAVRFMSLVHHIKNQRQQTLLCLASMVKRNEATLMGVYGGNGCLINKICRSYVDFTPESRSIFSDGNTELAKENTMTINCMTN